MPRAVLRRAGASLVAVVSLPLFVGALGGCATHGEDSPHIERNREAPSFAEFYDSVYREPWPGGVYIVNGDTPVVDLAGLRAFYAQLYADGGLIVHQANGTDAKWDGVQQANITYCVSDGFGANKEKVVEAFQAATTDGWELAAEIKFVHLTEEDANCDANNPNVLFDVRQVSGQPYLARAFFPDQSRATRNVLIDTSSFDASLPWPLAGIVAHELGHAIGFRHEHTRPESGTCFEDNSWRELTEYDSTSVMHYPQCNGTGEPLVISAFDKLGAAILYGPPGGGSCGDGVCFTDEDCSSCEQDCGACPECGNGTCERGEDCASCESDCGACPVCGNDSCEVTENCANCESDCGECSCEHPLCEQGAALEAICDPCVTEVCAVDSYCCSVFWDSLCVGEVETVCGRDCSGGGDGTPTGDE